MLVEKFGLQKKKMKGHSLLVLQLRTFIIRSCDLSNMYLLLAIQLQLQRNELIALMNLLNRLSESVKFVREFGPTAETVDGGKSRSLDEQGCPFHCMWSSLRIS